MNLTREFTYRISTFTYRISTVSTLPATTGSPFGERMYATIVEGEIEGPRLRARKGQGTCLNSAWCRPRAATERRVAQYRH